MLRLYAQRDLRVFLPAAVPTAVADLRHRWRERVLSRFGTLAAFLLLLCGGLWAHGEYVRHKSTLQEAETRRHIEQFAEGPVADAWQRLSAAWQAELDRQNALLARIASASAGERAAAVRDYRAFVLETVAAHGLEADIDTVLRFFNRLALCIRMQSCDRSVAAAWFGDLPWRFRNQHFFYLQEAYPGEDVVTSIRTVSPRPEPPSAAWTG